MRFRTAAFLIALTAYAIPSYAYRISAWIPPWDGHGLTSMQQNSGNVDESNPVWYTLDPTGAIAKNWNAEDPRLLAAMSGTQLMPTIQNYVSGRWDGALVATIVAAPDRREQHAEAITQLVVQNAFDGIDIDYESLPVSAKADFAAFVQLLGTKLHSAGKQLSITVHAKTADKGSWSAATAQDWAAIGAVADTVKIMAYNYHWSSSTAGPGAPLFWLDQIATYAESVIPSQKIMMGLPWYGYDWLGTRGTALLHSEAVAIAQREGAVIQRDVNDEATFTYGDRTVFFQDATSYARKIAMFRERHSGIGGFAHWRAGGEDPEIWNVIASLSVGSGTSPSKPVPPPAPAYFTMSGPSSIEARAGQQVSASYALVPFNGFSGEAFVTAEKLGNFAADITFSAPQVQAGTPVTMSVTPAATVAPGQYQLIVRMTKDALVAEQLVVVSVAAPEVVGSFELSVPQSVTVSRGRSLDVALGLEAINGYNGSAAFSVEAIDAFPGSATMITTTASPTDPALLRIIPVAHATAGTYRLRIRAVNGDLSRETIMTVTVPATRRRAARK